MLEIKPDTTDAACLYLLLLGRPGESDEVIAGKAAQPSLRACIVDFFASPEFKVTILQPILDREWVNKDGARRVDPTVRAWLERRFGIVEADESRWIWSVLLARFMVVGEVADAYCATLKLASAGGIFSILAEQLPMGQADPINVVGEWLYDIERSETAQGMEYKATGTDPQMILHDPATGSPIQLPPGNYLFIFEMASFSGSLSRPCIYTDFGDGISEDDATKHSLRPKKSGRWQVPVKLNRTALEIRFDPSETLCIFYNPRMSFLPLSEADVAALQAGADDDASAYRLQYLSNSAVAQGARAPWYAPLRASPVQVADDNAAKIIAYYLPQFHPFKENSDWWGRGFTEWTNVSKAIPQFLGHHQPRLPGELGHYDLRVPDVMARQIELAKHYGITGFCFHYYWFAGRRLLERPIEDFLANSSEAFDFPFSLCWANENWTRRWDGAEHSVLMKQEHSAEDNARVFADLLRYFIDPRYIKVDGKPVLTVYRPTIIPDIKAMVDLWQRLAREAGFPGIYLIATTAFGFDNASSIGFDAIAEFPPHGVIAPEATHEVEMLNPAYLGTIYNYADVVDSSLAHLETRDSVKAAYFPGVMMEWDNEARKPSRGNIFRGANPSLFAKWVFGALDWSKANNAPDRVFLFINAWNEWGEGTYLEPDRLNGYSYLSAIAAAREEAIEPDPSIGHLVNVVQSSEKKTSDTAICLYLFYPDLIEEFADAISELRTVHPVDVLLSFPKFWSLRDVQRAISKVRPTRIIPSENRGRDIWPFLQTLRVATEMGYKFGCKIHGKKSLHLGSGAQWRQNLTRSLIAPEHALAALGQLRRPDIGMAAPASAMFSIRDAAAMRDNMAWTTALLDAAGAMEDSKRDFVAGTMFWFKVDAMRRVLDLPFGRDEFGPELGAIDGTLAHAYERMFPTLVAVGGQEMGLYDGGTANAPY